MKSFLGTFVISIILCYLFLLFGGAMIIESIWGILILAALMLSILITAFIHQETKIEELETRLKALENQGDSK